MGLCSSCDNSMSSSHSNVEIFTLLKIKYLILKSYLKFVLPLLGLMGVICSMYHICSIYGTILLLYTCHKSSQTLWTQNISRIFFSKIHSAFFCLLHFAFRYVFRTLRVIIFPMKKVFLTSGISREYLLFFAFLNATPLFVRQRAI